VKPSDLVARFARLAHDATSQELTADEHAGLARLERALVARRGETAARRRGRWIVVGVSAVAAAAAAFLLSPRALTYEVTRGRASEGGYIVPAADGAVVRFSDRSELDLETETRLRVSHLEARGARLMLEGGLLHVHVNPRPQASWAIDAGPYVVHVTGTDFDVTWRFDEQALDLLLRHGSVTVDGPLAAGGIRMHAGQHLIANARNGSLSLVEDSAESPPGNAVTAGPPAPAVPATAAPAALPASGASRTSPRISGVRPAESEARTGAPPHEDAATWTTRLSHGDFAGILESAERRGIDRTLADASLADVGALADAARYARRREIARRALTAERARFASSLVAHDAAFFLGGLAEDEADARQALDWYEAYLRDSPDGSYAPQALGRTLSLVQQVRGSSDARTRAGEYLQRFPSGAYAPVARKLLQMQ
jgi:hypothetical protein